MNPFAALESDDDEDFVKVQSSKKTDSKGSKKPTQTQQKPAATTVATSSDNGNANKTSGRGGGGRGDTRNKGRGAGRGGKETGDRKNGKREYDRRSGTGRGSEVAKGGAGKGGWGTNEDEIAHQRKELESVESTTAEANTTNKAAVQEEPEEPVEPEKPTFTLDEFLAKRDASRQSSSVFSSMEVRQVTEDFKGLKTKDDDQSPFIVLGGGKTKSANAKSQRSTAQEKITNLGFHAAPKEDFHREERGGRGGRGGRGDRGGRGGPGGRGGNKSDRAPRSHGGKVDVNDKSAFPSL